jgi:hypothetical protein
MPIDAIMELFANDRFFLKANVDGVTCQYEPAREFYSYRDQFVKAIGRSLYGRY